VNEPRILQTDINERAKINNVEDSSLQFHTRQKILELEDSTLENWLGQIFSRITAWL
jgi:hypothetical protein